MSAVKLSLTRPLVLAIALLSFLLSLVFIEWGVLPNTNWVFAYPIDDTFIHLAIAKNLAFHQVWGISSHEFVSASSSLLYPLVLMTTVKIFGAHIIIPFVVNVLAGILLLLVVQRWLAKQEISLGAQLLILLGVVFLTPLPVLAMSGMEHILQLLFCFLFLTTFSDELGKLVSSGEKKWRLPWSVYVYGMLVVATRYEGLPLVAIACLVLLVHRRIILALELGLICALPVLVFGIYSLYQGGYFVPNSVLLKSGAPPMTFDGLYYFFTEGLFTKLFFSVVGYNTVATQRLLFLLPIAFILFNRPIRKAVSYQYMLIILMAAVFLHLALTGYAHFPRYEAYLIGCAVIVIGVVMAKYGREALRGKAVLTRWMAGLMGLFLVFPLLIRSKTAFNEVGQACINIYEQQYQMGQFLHSHYFHDPVAIGDIGAVSYYTESRNLDMVGLANIEVARSRKEHYNSPDFMDWLSKKDSVKIAICYDYFNDPNLLRRWDKIATWQIPNNVACGDDIVSFYAVQKGAGPNLKKNLLEFQKSLPREVVVKYY